MSSQPASNPPPHPSPADLVGFGLAAHRAGRLSEAEQYYRNAMTLHPGDLDAMHLLGVCRSQQGDFDQAIDLLQHCVRLDPRAGPARANLANALQQAGRFEEALAATDEAVALMPAQPDLLTNRANLLHRMGRASDAVAGYRHALALAPAHVGALLGLGDCLRKSGEFTQARVCFASAIAAAPGNAQAHYNLGVALADLDLPREALDAFDAALRLRPDDVDALRNRGLALLALERADEALASLDGAVRLRPDHADVHYTRANLLRELSRFEEALAAYDTAIRCDPDHDDAHFNRAVTLMRLDRHGEALAGFDRALAMRGEDAETLTQRGAALGELGRHVDALQDLTRALELEPGNAAAHSNHAVALNRLDRYEQAIAGFDRALELDAQLSKAYANRALALSELGRHAEALQDYEQAVAIDPDDPLVRMSVAMCRLRLGDFARGWSAIEARWREKSTGLFHWHDPAKLWLGGTEVRGRTILLHAEQGLGDTLQFCRYAPQVSARGATVWLEAQAPAVRLLDSLSGVQLVFTHGEAPPEYDLHVPLMSLPLAFGTTLETIPFEVPYLRAPADVAAYWTSLLGPRRSRPRIGLAWSGSPTHKNDRRRSIPLATLLPLAQADAEWVSLQVGVRESDRDAIPRFGLRTFDDRLADLAQTAGLIENLDLVITVDTAVAHLAGALARPVWVMLPFNPDWRWLLERSDCPWYPSARLFRQAAAGDWPGVVSDVLRALRESKFAGG